MINIKVVIQEEVVPAPKFTRPLQNQTPKPEGATVKLEAQVTKSPPPPPPLPPF